MTHGFNESAPGEFPDAFALCTPWPFQHTDLLRAGGEKKIPRSRLVNKINHLNFSGGELSVIFQHQPGGGFVAVSVYPHPCTEDDLVCRPALADAERELADYIPRYIMIEEGLEVAWAPVTPVGFHEQTLRVKLPEEGVVHAVRSIRRHASQGVRCDIVAADRTTGATLVDFTPRAFSLRLADPNGGEPFEPPPSARIDLYRGDRQLFSGICRLVRNGLGTPDGRLVYAPTDEEIRLFAQKKNRNPRRQIAPSFTVSFQHPFFPKRVERDIFDVSTSGFSIRDNPSEEILMPGMLISELVISFAGIIQMNCQAQVVYRREDPDHRTVQTGLAITDMDVLSYSRLNHLVGARLDAHARVSTTVDMEALWEFFFDTGFIYGEKYRHLFPYRQSFKETYRRLYQDNPDIARHFTYEKNGKIYGHIAMVHAYPPSWVIHHFSAKPLESRIPGLLILRQIIHYLSGCYRFRSAGIDYVMTYYRPNNQIVDKIFGGFARSLNNPRASSLDLFSYLHFDRFSSSGALPDGWGIRECLPGDFQTLCAFYAGRSGGLLTDAFGLQEQNGPITDSFRRAGFQRECRTYCLCRAEKALAFFIVNRSDLGLNLSDLLNGITVFIADEQAVSWDTLAAALVRLGIVYATDQIPTLIYPERYPADRGVRTDKHYQLWIMKTDPYADDYTEYMRLKFRIRYESAARS